MQRINSKTKRVLEFIKTYIAAHPHHEPPTIREIGEQFNLRSSASVFQILKNLEREGLITKTPNVSRGIRIVNQSPMVGWLDR